MAEDLSQEVSPAYSSFRTLLGFIQRLEGGIPQRLDRSFWGKFFSGSTGNQIIGSLRFLQLIEEDGRPSARLEQLVDPARRTETLREILTARYAAVFAEVDLARATSGQLEEVFRREYRRLSGETRRKAITFFVQAAQNADVKLSPYIAGEAKTAERSRTSRDPAARAATKRQRPASRTAADESLRLAEQDDADAGLQVRSAPADARTVRLRSGGSVTLTIAVDLFGVGEEDRRFVFELIDKLRTYERRRELDAASQPIEASPHGRPADGPEE